MLIFGPWTILGIVSNKMSMTTIFGHRRIEYKFYNKIWNFYVKISTELLVLIFNPYYTENILITFEEYGQLKFETK